MAKMGQRTGQLAVPALLLGLATSYFIQVRRARWAWTAGIVTALAVAGAVATPIVERNRIVTVPLRAVDREPLEVVAIEGVEYLQHPALGFRFERPTSDFAHSPELEGQLGEFGGPSMHLSFYAPAGAQMPAVMIQVQRFSRVDEAVLREFVLGFRQGLLGGVPAGSIDIRQEQVVWEPSFKGSHMHVAMNDMNARFETWVLPGEQYIVGMALIGADDELLTRIVASFRL